jgi:hypothetical protein
MGQKLIWKAFHETRRPKGLVNANETPRPGQSAFSSKFPPQKNRWGKFGDGADWQV